MNTQPVQNEWEKDFDTKFKIFEQVAEEEVDGTFAIEDDRERVKSFIRKLLSKVRAETKIDENTSDGYHTFKELYEFRKLYSAALFNEWAKKGLYDVHKSIKHHDGEDCFGGGWFIVVAQLPTGQISNHYEMKDWDLFHVEERERGTEWDGHTPQDVAKRLNDFLLSTLYPNKENK